MFAEELHIGTALMKPPTRTAMVKLWDKWHETGSVHNRKKNRQNSVRIKESVAIVQGIMKENVNISLNDIVLNVVYIFTLTFI